MGQRMKVLLITPPMTQLNSPYAATPMLTAFLRSRGIDAVQEDLSLELALRLFSKKGIRAMAGAIRRSRKPSVRFFQSRVSEYEEAVDLTIRFLQGRDPSLAHRFARRGSLPEGPRFEVLRHSDLDRQMEPQDRAKYYASLFIDDLADVIHDAVDPRFELSRYGGKLAASAPSFDPIRKSLEHSSTLIDRMIDRMTRELCRKHRPALVALTAPFPGNVYGAFRIARAIRKGFPRTRIVLGGGYVNTELRDLSDPAVFDYVDYITLDDGESALLSVIDSIKRKGGRGILRQTFVREQGHVVFKSGRRTPAILHRQLPVPSFEGLDLSKYISVCEMPNPMHRLWSDGCWNKLMLAHGCYWKKCGFCDTCLDYIGRYDPAPASVLVDRIEAMIRATGRRGFHFVDEAASPALLRSLARELLRRKTAIAWWCNIRFEKAFTPELASLLARAGCVAVTGGLEAAVDRLLKLVNKGITVAQAARAARAFSEAGILVHAYLMYGLPTQTAQETVDALETVRRLFDAGYIQSAYWHRFALTVHSPMARDPERYGIRLLPVSRATFARNEIPWEEKKGIDHSRFAFGLRKAVYNFMHGAGLERGARSWFDFDVPRPSKKIWRI